MDLVDSIAWNILERVAPKPTGCDGLPPPATLVMPGGIGTHFLDVRDQLCPAYLAAFPAAVRAYANLWLLGGRDAKDQHLDKWQAKEFRIACAAFLEQLAADAAGVALTRVALGERWRPVLAVCKELVLTAIDDAQARKKAKELFVAARHRCARGPVDVAGSGAAARSGFEATSENDVASARVVLDRQMKRVAELSEDGYVAEAIAACTDGLASVDNYCAKDTVQHYAETARWCQQLAVLHRHVSPPKLEESQRNLDQAKVHWTLAAAALARLAQELYAAPTIEGIHSLCALVPTDIARCEPDQSPRHSGPPETEFERCTRLSGEAKRELGLAEERLRAAGLGLTVKAHEGCASLRLGGLQRDIRRWSRRNAHCLSWLGDAQSRTGDMLAAARVYVLALTALETHADHYHEDPRTYGGSAELRDAWLGATLLAKLWRCKVAEDERCTERGDRTRAIQRFVDCMTAFWQAENDHVAAVLTNNDLHLDFGQYYGHELAPDRLTTPLVRPAGFAIREQKGWGQVGLQLQAPTHRGRLLALFFLHILHARLHITSPERHQENRPFYQWLWQQLTSLAAGATPNSMHIPSECHGRRYRGLVSAMQPTLARLTLFNGTDTIEAQATSLPACFGRFKFGPLPRLELLLRQVPEGAKTGFEAAYFLATTIADRLLDPMHAARAGNCTPSQEVYRNLEQLMRTSRYDSCLGDRHTPSTSPRTMEHRLFKQLERGGMQRQIRAAIGDCAAIGKLVGPRCCVVEPPTLSRR
jgi:hypothetical protein